MASWHHVLFHGNCCWTLAFLSRHWAWPFHGCLRSKSWIGLLIGSILICPFNVVSRFFQYPVPWRRKVWLMCETADSETCDTPTSWQTTDNRLSRNEISFNNQIPITGVVYTQPLPVPQMKVTWTWPACVPGGRGSDGSVVSDCSVVASDASWSSAANAITVQGTYNNNSTKHISKQKLNMSV